MSALAPSQQRAREITKAWFAAHPNYQRTRQAAMKQRRAETGLPITGNLPARPRTDKNKLAYEITHTDERMNPK